MRCPSCGHDNGPDGRFCTECGATLSGTCPSCGVPVDAGDKFCGGCGARLQTVLPPLAPAPTAPPDPAPAAPSPAEVGERRQLTVLLCDLVGSTGFSQQLDAEAWHDVIAQYRKAARTQSSAGAATSPSTSTTACSPWPMRFGTDAHSGAFEFVFLRLAQFQEGRFVGLEAFEPEDLASALARFEELRTADGGSYRTVQMEDRE